MDLVRRYSGKGEREVPERSGADSGSGQREIGRRKGNRW